MLLNNVNYLYYFIYVIGAVYKPVAYTLDSVTARNGSNSSGGCPTDCRTQSDDTNLCECTEGNTTGVLIDGIVPNIDTSQTNSWAANIYTIYTQHDNIAIGFMFEQPIALQAIELSMFFCNTLHSPNGAIAIKIFQEMTFPNFSPTNMIGNKSLSSDKMNCNSLCTFYINISSIVNSEIVFVQFVGQTQLGGLYIGEVKFSDTGNQNSSEI